METWVFNIVVSLCIASLLKSVYDFFFPKLNLPPGPTTVPFVGSLLWFFKSSSELEPKLRDLNAKYGPIVTLQVGSERTIFISDNSLAYKALIQNGAVFANRPEALPTFKFFSSNQHNIAMAYYGPVWRRLRRNLTAEMLHPSRMRGYSEARRWVSEILTSRLRARSESGEPVRVVDLFQYTMFCLLVLMCFGDKLEEKQIQEIETIQRRLLLSFPRFKLLDAWPRLGKVLFRRRWKEFYQLRRTKENILLPYIRARQQLKEEKLIQSKQSAKDYVVSYVDTLLDLQLPSEDNRKLTEGEIIGLCSEFLDAGTDTTTTSLQWIMANLVKYPHIQGKLFEEISGVIGEGKEGVEEEYLQKMPYLKAVVLEGLRRHPPSQFVATHTVTEDINFEGYFIPKDTSVNFLITEMNWNPKIWEDPMEFKPERFFTSSNIGNGNNGGDHDQLGVFVDFDITGSREIKMLTFGAGRRMCPGFGLGILHMEYFIANLVYSYEWKAVEGDEVDLSEKQELTVKMKNPLQVRLSPRWK